MRDIKRIIVHCTASPDNLDIGAKEINQWHLDRGWSGIGYHWVIRRDGTIESGRNETSIGAHVSGHNADTIGIVWVGTDKIEEKQMDALVTKVKDCMYRYNIRTESVLGHYELYSGKTCPNLKMDDFRSSLSIEKKAEYLPDEPSEEDIESSLADIEKFIWDEE